MLTHHRMSDPSPLFRAPDPEDFFNKGGDPIYHVVPPAGVSDIGSGGRGVLARGDEVGRLGISQPCAFALEGGVLGWG